MRRDRDDDGVMNESDREVNKEEEQEGKGEMEMRLKLTEGERDDDGERDGSFHFLLSYQIR